MLCYSQKKKKKKLKKLGLLIPFLFKKLNKFYLNKKQKQNMTEALYPNTFKKKA